MKYFHTRAPILIVMATLICQAISLESLSYSAKDDVEAARAYNAQNGHNPTAARHYTEAADLLVKQRFAQATPLLEEAIKLDPRLASAYAGTAYCLTWKELFLEGAEALTKAIGIDNKKPLFFYRKALCFFSIGQMDDAISQLDHAISLKPDDADSLRLRARCFSHKQYGFTNAIADYSSLIKANAYTVESLCERGKLYFQNNEDEKALKDFDEAARIQSDAAEAFIGRANVFYRQRRYRLAADNYSAAIVNGTDKNSFCEVQRGHCLKLLKNTSSPATLNTASPDHDKRTK